MSLHRDRWMAWNRSYMSMLVSTYLYTPSTTMRIFFHGLCVRGWPSITAFLNLDSRLTISVEELKHCALMSIGLCWIEEIGTRKGVCPIHHAQNVRDQNLKYCTQNANNFNPLEYWFWSVSIPKYKCHVITQSEYYKGVKKPKLRMNLLFCLSHQKYAV